MELFRALASLSETPASAAVPLADALEIGPVADEGEYTDLFIFQLPPYASIYLGAEGMIGGPARELIAGFWRTLKAEPPKEPDHLATMLALYARLSELEEGESEPLRRESLRRARTAFLWEHLLSWLPVYLSKLDQIAAPFYRRWGEILLEALRSEACASDGCAQLPLHLREAAGLIDPRAGGEVKEFLRSLLSPVQSGMILTRFDLSRAGRELDLGLRMGERAFVLKAILAQESEGVLAWMANEASCWAKLHRANRRWLGKVAAYWEERAVATRKLLEELRAEAREAL
jgi:TorA maturation chaperone TorD